MPRSKRRNLPPSCATHARYYDVSSPATAVTSSSRRRRRAALISHYDRDRDAADTLAGSTRG